MKGCRPFTEKEVIKMIIGFKTLPHKHAMRDLAWFSYGVCTGFRISELLSMRIKDCAIKYKGKYQVTDVAYVRKGFTKRKKQGDRKKVDNWARDYMQIWLDYLHEKGYAYTDFVFQNQHKKNDAIKRGYAHRIIQEVASGQQIYSAIGTHSLRKTFVNKRRLFFLQKAKQEGVDIDPNEILMMEGRWSSRDVMEAYLSFIPFMFEEEVFNTNEINQSLNQQLRDNAD